MLLSKLAVIVCVIGAAYFRPETAKYFELSWQIGFGPPTASTLPPSGGPKQGLLPEDPTGIYLLEQVDQRILLWRITEGEPEDDAFTPLELYPVS
jgi:hypothetical protein